MGHQDERDVYCLLVGRKSATHSIDQQLSPQPAWSGWAMSVSCSELSVVAVTPDGASFLCRSTWPTVAHNYPASNTLSVFLTFAVPAQALPDGQPAML